jgi:hypothetical protein
MRHSVRVEFQLGGAVIAPDGRTTMPRSARTLVPTLLFVLLLAAAGLGCFVAGLTWLVDFDDSEPATGAAGVVAVVLGLGCVAALVVAAVRRSAHAGSLTLVGSAVVALLGWMYAR